jgi:hypothetical protein
MFHIASFIFSRPLWRIATGFDTAALDVVAGAWMMPGPAHDIILAI